ncbi:potassium channel family protein [Actinoplanes flavus]|uniref:Two pore domain potassium channel family protein n=1 Tax=Actinoplanes flavus TaxID=2820290 RepID=A0ABS3UKF1_9ACTN|nr:potassium channel family protein [Actinoplanes flavus]MBO3739244.1 two pore domain potassium channel family protein [Actinoplanes flavus]
MIGLRPRTGYGTVLLLIIGTYVLALLVRERWQLAVLLLVQTVTVWQALRVSRARSGMRFAAAGVFLLALIAALLNLVLSRHSPLIGWTFLAASTLYLLAPFAIVRHLSTHRGVDKQTLLGALAAYLLIGMAFGFAYQCLGVIQPGPLFGDKGEPNMSDSLFFSFVTMTTTGYGDLTPAGDPARTIAVVEALTGSLFLVTAVAKVVENWRPRNWDNGDDSRARDE